MRNSPKYLDPNRAVRQRVPLIIVQKSRIKFRFRFYYGKACCLVLSLNNGNCPVPSRFARDDSKLRCPYPMLRNDVKIFNTVLAKATRGFKIWTSFLYSILCSINKTIDGEKMWPV